MAPTLSVQLWEVVQSAPCVHSATSPVGKPARDVHKLFGVCFENRRQRGTLISVLVVQRA
eukprot:4856917-Lingulodinium_polyedra.AAC.1